MELKFVLGKKKNIGKRKRRERQRIREEGECQSKDSAVSGKDKKTQVAVKYCIHGRKRQEKGKRSKEKNKHTDK